MKTFLLSFVVCCQLFAAPALFYTDLDSGPVGSFVTLYGNNLGSSGSVTMGISTATVISWSPAKVVVQIPANATTGSLVATTGGASSNSLPFTVRAGNLRFVATNGADSAAGTLAAPWRSIPYAVQHIAPGDVIYVRDGVVQSAADDWSAALLLRNEWCGGALPRALVAYPGAKVTIGSLTAQLASIRTTDSSASGGACSGSWTIAGLYMPSVNGFTIAGGSNWRIVGNEFTCPSGDGAGACVETSQATNIKFYGNNTHDAGKVGASALYQGVYFSTDSNHLDIGWNTIANARGCRGLQVHSSPLGPGGSGDPTGHNQFDISIHDNVIHDTQCDGIVLATVDPSQGQVSVYRNVVYRAGKGGTPEGTGTWTCLNVRGDTNNGTAGGGTVEVYSNTFYDCGAYPTPPYVASGSIMNAGGNPKLSVRIRNNILAQRISQFPYLVMFQPGFSSACSTCTTIAGTNNLFFGAGPSPTNGVISASLNADPLFVNATAGDFHLQANSPARTGGVATGLASDIDGVPFASIPIGAYGAGGGVVVPPVVPPVTPPVVVPPVVPPVVLPVVTPPTPSTCTLLIVGGKLTIVIAPSSSGTAAVISGCIAQ